LKKTIFIISLLALTLSIVLFILKDEVYTNNTIVFGASLPKTGIMKDLGKDVEYGTNAYFKYANDNNLLKNKKIKFITHDDKYEPELTKKNIKQLINTDKVFALYGFVGTPTVEKILPIIKNTNIPFIAPFTGASFLREKKHKNIINFRSSYFEEIEKIVAYLHDVKGLNKFAVFYQNDNYGEEGYISLIKALEKRKLKLTADGTYKRNTLSIRHAFQEMKDSKPEAIIMVGAYKANALFINKAKNDENFKDTIFCNISFGVIDTIIKNTNDTKNLLFSQVVPSYTNTDIPVVKEYQEIMKKYCPDVKYGFISFEAFLAAKVVVNTLQNMKGDITKDKFLTQIKKVKKNVINGLNIRYQNSQLLNSVYLFEYQDKQFHEIKWKR